MTLGPKTEKLASIRGKRDSHSSHDPRYSRFVGRLKIVLPLVAGILALAIFVWPQVSRGIRDVVASQTLVPSIDRLKMANPRYYGLDEKNQGYVLTADEAIQDATTDGRIEFVNPKGSLNLEDGAELKMDALKGDFLRDDNTLILIGDVNLFHDGGYEMHTQRANIDLEAGAANGQEPVQGEGPFGEIESEGFQLTERGKNIVFTGKSKLILRNTAALDKKERKTDKE